MRKKLITFTICFILLFLTACGNDVYEEQNAGYAWGELQQRGQEDAVYCNLPENINGLDYIIPVCYDSYYGIFYYVNYGQDFYIYGCRDDEIRKIADIPAKRLFCRNGRLYFIVESYDICSLNGYSEGNILEYNPVTGQISVIVEEQVTSMIVYQDGIYYSRDIMRDIGNGFFIIDKELEYYSFGDGSMGELAKLDGIDRTLYRCGQDFLFYVLEPYQGEDEELLKLADGGEITMTTGMKLGNRDTAEGKLLDNLLVLNNFYTTETEIYYIENFEDYSEFVIYNTELDTETRYPLSMLVEGAYIVVDNSVYFGSFQKLDLESGRETSFSTDEMYSIMEWYTDGSSLYGLCNIYKDGSSVVQIQRIEMQDGKVHFVPMTEETEG